MIENGVGHSLMDFFVLCFYFIWLTAPSSGQDQAGCTCGFIQWAENAGAFATTMVIGTHGRGE